MHRPMRETRSGMALLQVAFTDVLRLEETELEQQSTPATSLPRMSPATTNANRAATTKRRRPNAHEVNANCPLSRDQ